MIVTVADVRKYDVILDPLTAMDSEVAEVESDGDIVTLYDTDGVPQSFLPEQRVALLERPWPQGMAESDMLDRLQAVIGSVWGAVVVADGDPDAMRAAVRGHALELRDALDVYLLGRSDAALAASDPDAPAPLPQE